MPKTQDIQPTDLIVPRTKEAAWTFLDVEGNLVTYLPFGDEQLGESYASAWNDCALRAERLDLVIVTAVFSDGTLILTAPKQLMPKGGKL